MCSILWSMHSFMSPLSTSFWRYYLLHWKKATQCFWRHLLTKQSKTQSRTSGLIFIILFIKSFISFPPLALHRTCIAWTCLSHYWIKTSVFALLVSSFYLILIYILEYYSMKFLNLVRLYWNVNLLSMNGFSTLCMALYSYGFKDWVGFLSIA